MKSRKLTLTIGIPVYNEAANIGKLLKRLLTQLHDTYTLRSIIVVNDGSTDRTAAEIKKIRSVKIRQIINRNRCGQIYCQNLIFMKAKTDITVLLEGDTLPVNNQYLRQLVSTFYRYPGTGFVQGNIRTAVSGTVFGKIIAKQKDIYHRFTEQDPAISRWFSSGRGGRAFSKKVYRQLRWPPSVPEDDYALLWCISHNILTKFQAKARCFYKVPQNLEDYITQINKNNAAEIALQSYYPPGLIRNIYKRPRWHQIFMIFYFMAVSPVYFAVYFIINIMSRVKSKTGEFSDVWTTSISTKQIST